jgi:ADP-heptose:LPS heptosyltransferase
MEQVISQLLQKYPKARIFLFGRGKDENIYFQQWTERYPQCLFVGQHCETMYQELILMSHLDVMLSMDSANMHLASLTGTPVVSIWGATHPMAGFLGYNQKEENIIQTDLDCRPCSIFGNKKCHRGDYACLQNIPLERIVDRITTLINN